MRALICGGGIAGLTLAWWLTRTGWEVGIVEIAPSLRDEGYMTDFFGPGFTVAERMGLVPRLRDVHAGVPELVYVDSRGRRRAALDFALAQRVQRGKLLSLLRGDHERVLFEALDGAADVKFGCTVEEVTPVGDRVEVVLSDGSEEQADLLVGADGIHSRVRELAFGAEERFLRPLGYHTAAYAFYDEEVESELRGAFRMRSEPGREAGLYPVGGGKVMSFFAHEASGTRPAQPGRELERVHGDLGWLVPRALERRPGDDDLYYDVVAQVELPRWHRGRVVLVGDAAGAVSLLAGQGASLAMAGAWALARELEGGGGIEEALARYESRVAPVVQRTQGAGRRAARWVVPASRARIAVRGVVLGLSRLPGLTRMLRPLLRTPADDLLGQADT